MGGDTAGGGGGPKMDFLTEIRLKLEKKQQQQQQQQQSEENNHSDGSTGSASTETKSLSSSSSSGGGGGYKNGPSSNLAQTINSQRKFGTGNVVNGNGINNKHITNTDSPKTIKKITSTPNVVNGNGCYTNGSGSGGECTGNCEKMKQELMAEIQQLRKEMLQMKMDILNALESRR